MAFMGASSADHDSDFELYLCINWSFYDILAITKCTDVLLKVMLTPYPASRKLHIFPRSFWHISSHANSTPHNFCRIIKLATPLSYFSSIARGDPCLMVLTNPARYAQSALATCSGSRKSNRRFGFGTALMSADKFKKQSCGTQYLEMWTFCSVVIEFTFGWWRGLCDIEKPLQIIIRVFLSSD